jgi:hypothetical protein
MRSNSGKTTFRQRVDGAIEKLGITPFPVIDVDPSLLIIPKTIDNLSDEAIDDLYFAAQTYSAYIAVQASEADSAKRVAESKKDMLLSRLILISDERSADSKRADAVDDPNYQTVNNNYLEKLAIYTELNSLRLAWEKVGETYSRIMTRRRSYWEQDNMSSNKRRS